MLTIKARQQILKTIMELAESAIEETGNDSRMASISATEINVAWFESEPLKAAIQITRDVDKLGQRTYHIETTRWMSDGSTPTVTLWSISIMQSTDKSLYITAVNNKEALFRWNTIPEKPLRKLLSVLATAEYRPWIPKEPTRLEINLHERGIDV